MGNISDAICTENQNTHFIFNFFFENRAVYEIMWKNIVQSSWNVMAHGDAREGKWRGNWRMEWVASTLHTTSEHGVSSITTADAHTLAASRRPNLRLPADLKGLVRFAERRNLVSARVPSHFNWPQQPSMPHDNKWHMRIACWVIKATNTHTRYVQYLLFFHYTPLNIALYVRVYWLSCLRKKLGIVCYQFRLVHCLKKNTWNLPHLRQAY